MCSMQKSCVEHNAVMLYGRTGSSRVGFSDRLALHIEQVCLNMYGRKYDLSWLQDSPHQGCHRQPTGSSTNESRGSSRPSTLEYLATG